jgi:hypothetical protein
MVFDSKKRRRNYHTAARGSRNSGKIAFPGTPERPKARRNFGTEMVFRFLLAVVASVNYAAQSGDISVSKLEPGAFVQVTRQYNVAVADANEAADL